MADPSALGDYRGVILRRGAAKTTTRLIGRLDQTGRLRLCRTRLYSLASKGQPSGGSIGAIIRPRIEGNRCSWGGHTNRVDDRFK
jgi:hypothetical protein